MAHNKDINDDYTVISVEEAMDYLKIGKNNLYELLRSGAIKSFRVGRKWRIPKKSIYEYIDKEIGDKDINTKKIKK